MKTLEDILQEYFGCEKPFHSPSRDDKAECTTGFTKEGLKSYDKLVQFVYDIHALTSRQGADEMVDTLDALTWRS